MASGTFLPPGLRQPPAEAFDGVTDASGSGTFATIQAADDFLDGGAYALWVKSGTYAAGFTVSTNNAYIYVEPGTVIEDAITLSGDGITLVFGAQCDIQGLITVSDGAVNCSILCQNGVDMVGVNVGTGAFFLFDGGGWDTLIDGGADREAFVLNSPDAIIKNFAAQTTTGGTSDRVVNANNARQIIRHVKVVDSAHDGIAQYSQDGLIEGCVILGADNDGIAIHGPTMRVLGNYVIGAGREGIHVGSGGDNSVIVGNIVKSATGDGIELNGDNCVAVGNRFDGAIDDNGTGTIVAGNNLTAF
jgi:hypothetical protein